MRYDEQEEQGRILLRSLLWFYLIVQAAGYALTWQGAAPVPAALLSAGLLPTGVILWAFHRGNQGAYVLFFIQMFLSLGSSLDTLQFSRGTWVNSPTFLCSLLSLFLALAVIAVTRTRQDVAEYLSKRRAWRGKKDWILEVCVFLASVAAAVLCGSAGQRLWIQMSTL